MSLLQGVMGLQSPLCGCHRRCSTEQVRASYWTVTTRLSRKNLTQCLVLSSNGFSTAALIQSISGFRARSRRIWGCFVVDLSSIIKHPKTAPPCIAHSTFVILQQSFRGSTSALFLHSLTKIL